MDTFALGLEYLPENNETAGNERAARQPKEADGGVRPLFRQLGRHPTRKAPTFKPGNRRLAHAGGKNVPW